MNRSGPAWLGDLQAQLGALLRTPLDRSTGTLTASIGTYDPSLVSATRDAPSVTSAARLAVYNRQYWFRLFDTLRAAFPLTARLVGAWTFNDHASRFFLAHAPQGWDLDHAGDGFAAFFATDVANAPDAQTWTEAVRIDEAWREVQRAPAVPPFHPSPADAARLPAARLVRSPAAAFVDQRWPLLELRRALVADGAEGRIAVPAPLPRATHWALVRTDRGIEQIALEAREAELLTLLQAHPVREALARLESSCPPDEREALPERTRGWLARSVQRGVWSGLA